MAVLLGESTRLCPRRVCGMAALYSQALTPPEFAVIVSSAGVKMQDGRKGRKKERKPTQNRTNK